MDKVLGSERAKQVFWGQSIISGTPDITQDNQVSNFPSANRSRNGNKLDLVIRCGVGPKWGWVEWRVKHTYGIY